jgi:glycosyltransferase involved in cell wall biosynthesis
LKNDARPEAILLSNVLISGMVPDLKKALGVPIFGILQGDDIYLEALPADDRRKCIDLIRTNCEVLTGLIATSTCYADFMAQYLGVPRDKIHVVHPGIKLKGHGGQRPIRESPPYTVGYFARICPEKGFHLLAEAFRILRQTSGAPECRLRISGWLGENNRAYFNSEMDKLHKAGLGGAVEHVPSPDHAGKIAFLQSIDVLSVPTVYREPKGIYILEALANGVPVVQPRHGSFPELIEATGGGLLVEPDDPGALADGIRRMLSNVAFRKECADRGRAAVHAHFTDDNMATATVAVINDL